MLQSKLSLFPVVGWADGRLEEYKIRLSLATKNYKIPKIVKRLLKDYKLLVPP